MARLAVAERGRRGRSPARSRWLASESAGATSTRRLPSSSTTVSFSHQVALGEIVHPGEVGRDEDVGRGALLDLLGERRARRVGDHRLLAGLGLPGGVDVVERVLQARRREDRHVLCRGRRRQQRRRQPAGGQRRRETSARGHSRPPLAGSLDRCIRADITMATRGQRRQAPGENIAITSTGSARRADRSSPASMWARCSNISLAPAASSRGADRLQHPVVLVGAAAVGARAAEHADDERGAGHELAHHPLEHPVAGDLGQHDVEMPREPDRVPPVAVPVGAGLRLPGAPRAGAGPLPRPRDGAGARCPARWRAARRRRRAPAPAVGRATKAPRLACSSTISRPASTTRLRRTRARPTPNASQSAASESLVPGGSRCSITASWIRRTIASSARVAVSPCRTASFRARLRFVPNP